MKSAKRKHASVQGLDSLYIPTGVFEEMWKFWTDIVGLKETVQWGDKEQKNRAGTIDFGNAHLTIAEAPQGRSTEFGYTIRHGKPEVFVRTSNIDDIFKKMNSRGARILRRSFQTHWGPRAFSVEAPDGLVVIFIEQA